MKNKFYDRNSTQAWERVFNGVNYLGITRLNTTNSTGLKYVNNEFNEFGGFLYNQNKNYQFTTSVTGPALPLLSIKLSAPFNAGIVSETRGDISTIGGVLFYTYANPVNTEYSNDIIKYGAYENFSTSYIESSNVNEIDFLINGYREFLYLDKANDHPDQPNGWCYDASTGIGSYNWYFSSSSNVIAPTYSTFGSGLEVISPNNNYIATLIDYDYFNLSFNFSFSGGGSNDKIEVFLVNQSDLKLGRNSNWELITFEVGGSTNGTSSLTINDTYSQINLAATNINGTKRYLVFRPSMVGTRTTTYTASLSIISIVGGYNPLNNLQVLPVTSSTINNLDINIPESIYTYDSVINGFTYSLSSKIGNGHFKAGIWENGVWNNGWRDDTEAKDFDDIYSAILYAYDISWKIKINGSKISCDSFKVGDKVSIGNIVAIDINENRKLIRDYYSITDKGSDGIGSSMINWIEVSLDTTFPYRRIEKDSPNHKIKVTKNVWLSGAFFNGYFSGVWNNGLFKGYPKITEMFNTHWIDGFFNGGHFNSNYPNYYFSDITATANCDYNNITLVFGDVVNFINLGVGIQPDDYKPGHNLLPGDYITIDKDPIRNGVNKVIYNPEYNGICRVMSVNGNNVVVNKKYLKNLHPVPEIGKVTRYAASSVIQNFKFYDTNKSLLKSSESSISSSIFSFNSWIDTNYDTTRSVTLGRDFRSYEPLTHKSVNRNNLYGYPTYDVLSSAARFRNSFNLDYGLYKLGTKYKLFNDFIGDASGFNEPFNPAQLTIFNFYNDGWSFSTKNTTDLVFNRSEAVISTDNASIYSTTIQDYIDSGVTGNELYLTATYSGAILNNDRITTKKSRYTVVEFDVVTYSIANSKFTYTNQSTYNIITDSINLSSPAATQSNSSTNPSIAVTASRIYSLNSDTLIDGSVNFLDGFDGVVYSIDKQADGSLIVAGIFNNYRGTPVNRVCKLNATTGDLDTTFNTNISSIFVNLPTSQIKVLVVKSGILYHTNKVDWIYVMVNYAAGVTISGNTIKGRIFRVSNSGVEDTVWTSTNYGFNCSNYKKANSINDMALETAGNLYVIGQFTQYIQPSISINYVNRLCILNPNGNLSSIGENAGTTSTRFFVNINDIPTTIEIMPDGRIVIGGNITKFAQSANFGHLSALSYYTLKGIIVLKKTTNTSGTIGIVVDASFLGVGSPGSTYPAQSRGFTTTGFNDFINKIKVDSLNRIYVVGNFSGYNDASPRACFNIARLTSTGAYDNTFVTGQGLLSGGYDIELSTSYVYVAGLFTKYNNLDCGKVIKLDISNGSLVSSVGLLNPSSSVVRAIKINNNNLIIGGSFETYKNIVITSSVNQTITTSYCVQSLLISPSDILNLAVELNLDCNGSNLGNITINLKSPDDKVINLKTISASSTNTQLSNTIFDIMATNLLSTGTSPFSGTFSMDKVNQRGTIGFISNSTTISQLVTTNASGNWTIYIQNDGDFPTLINWKLITTYKKIEIDPAIEITPSVDLPILHFNNLNYEIGSQPTVNGQSNLIYRRMSYLPITQNINHLLTQNSFRFDSIEKTSAERISGFGTNTIKKKYEYFYNKTDLMMSIQGNGEMGASQSMLVLDNIKMYETDMIPFFKYFEDANIYKGIQVPYEGVAPNIDYLNSDFIFVDNITIGLDSINNTIIDNNFVCMPNVLIIASSSVIVTTAIPTNITETSAVVGGNITTQGVTIVSGGVLVGTTNIDPLVVNTTNNGINYSSSGNFSGPVSSPLINNTTYNARAYVITYELYATGGASSQTTTYGATISFTTVATPPDYSSDYSPTDYSH